MLDVNEILFCTDLSKSSQKSFDYAVYLAHKTNAEIHILHVVEKLSNDAVMALESYVMDSATRAEMLKARKRQAQEKIERVQQEFWAQCDPELQGVQHKIKSIQILESFPTEAILKTSRDLNVDLIVMGTHEKGFVETFLGSVAKGVLARSRIPVFVVPIKPK